MGTHPHLMSVEKARTKIIFLQKPREITNASAAKQKPEPTPNKNKNLVGLPHEPRRNGRNICQANVCRQHLEESANQQPQDNILRPIINIMLKDLSMFMFW